MTGLINEATSILMSGSLQPFDQQRQEAAMANNPLAMFVEPRHPDDICLVSIVRDCFARHGFSQEAIDYFNNTKLVIDASFMRPIAQRHLLNRFFRSQMLAIRDQNSINERTCLIDTGEFSDWSRLFEESVIPFMLKNNLPRNLF